MPDPPTSSEIFEATKALESIAGDKLKYYLYWKENNYTGIRDPLYKSWLLLSSDLDRRAENAKRNDKRKVKKFSGHLKFHNTFIDDQNVDMTTTNLTNGSLNIDSLNVDVSQEDLDTTTLQNEAAKDFDIESDVPPDAIKDQESHLILVKASPRKTICTILK